MGGGASGAGASRSRRACRAVMWGWLELSKIRLLVLVTRPQQIDDRQDRFHAYPCIRAIRRVRQRRVGYDERSVCALWLWFLRPRRVGKFRCFSDPLV